MEKTNDREVPMLVWLEPFGVPVCVPQDGRFRIEFTCNPAEVQSFEFGAYQYYSLPSECQVSATVQHAEETVPVDLKQAERGTAAGAATSEPEFQRMIDHLCMTIRTTQEFQIGDDCAEALNKIGNVAAINALFCAYKDVQECLFDSLPPRIIYWLNQCVFDTPDKRAAGMEHLDFLRGLITQAPGIAPESCRRAFYLMSKMQEQSAETIDLMINLIERIARLTDHEWQVTRDAAILFVEKRAKGLIRSNAKLRETLGDSKVLDPMHYCQICNYFFQSRKEFGDICPDCKFEFGVDDAAHYWHPGKNEG